AKRVAPFSSEALWSYGNFLLRQNQLQAAFPEIRRAVELDPKRGAEAFSRCRRFGADPKEILDNAIPPSFDSYSEIIFELANENQVDLMLAVWKRAAPLPGIMQPQIVAVAGAALVQSERGEDAAQFWREATQKFAHPIPEDTSGSVLWDGGFE